MLGPRNTADAPIGIEVAAIAQGRLARLDSHAAHRALVGLRPPRRCKDISSDPEVRHILRAASDSPDQVAF